MPSMRDPDAVARRAGTTRGAGGADDGGPTRGDGTVARSATARRRVGARDTPTIGSGPAPGRMERQD